MFLRSHNTRKRKKNNLASSCFIRNKYWCTVHTGAGHGGEVGGWRHCPLCRRGTQSQLTEGRYGEVEGQRGPSHHIPGQVNISQTEPSHSIPGQVNISPTEPSHPIPGQVNISQTEPCHPIPGQVNIS